MSKKGFMDPLAALSGEDSEASSSDGEEEQQAAGGDPAGGGPAGKRQKQSIDLETLKQHGYQGGLSVLFVPEKNDEEQNWAWGSGTAHKGGEAADESFEEREANRQAVTEKAEDSAVYARKAVEQAELLRQQRREEQQKLKQDKKFTWNQKEKRKRDEGKATQGKNYVEEEKRRAREYGIVSGFD